MPVTFIVEPTSSSLSAYANPTGLLLTETASRVAVELAEVGYRVLLVGNEARKQIESAPIVKKPRAIRRVPCRNGWAEALETVSAFCRNVNDVGSKAWAAGARFKPMVVLNDADFFFSDGGGCGQFTKSCGTAAMNRVHSLADLVKGGGGSLFVTAALSRSRKNWVEIARNEGWMSRERRRLLCPDFLMPNEIGASENDDAAWFRPASESPPMTHPFGPITGSQRELSRWTFYDGKTDSRRLKCRVRSGAIWVRKLHYRSYEVWLQTQADYESCEKRRQEEQIRK